MESRSLIMLDYNLNRRRGVVHPITLESIILPISEQVLYKVFHEV